MIAKPVKIEFIGDPSSLKKAADESATAVEGMGTKIGKVAEIAAGFVVGSALTDLPGKLLGMAQAAADDEANVLKLKTAVENSGTSFESVNQAIDDRIKKGQDLAFSDDETRNALTALIQETSSTEEAMNRLTVAQDLARGTGMDLETAAKLLGKTSDENTATLKRYGITVADNATAQDVMNEVDKRFGGQAAAFAQTGAADMLKLKDQVSEAQEQLGAYLLPAIVAVTGVLITFVGILQTDVIPAIGVVAGFVRDNLTPILLGAAPVIIALGVAILSSAIPAFIAWTATLYAQVVAWIALNASMLPVIAVALAIGAAIVLLYEAWSHNFLGIQDITQTVIDFVGPYITTALDAIQTAFTTVLDAITLIWGPFWTAVQTAVETVWPLIQTAVETAITAISTVIQSGIDAIALIWGPFWDGVKLVIDTVWPLIQAVVETYIALVRDEIQLGIDAINLIWGPAWDAIKAVVTTVWDAATGIASVVQIGIDAVKSAIDTVMALLRTAWETAWGGIKGALSDFWDAGSGIVFVVTDGIGQVKSAISTVMDDIKLIWDTAWGGLKSTVTTIVSDIEGIVSGVISAINGVIGRINSALSFSVSVPGWVPGIGGNSWSFSANIPTIPDPFGGNGSYGGPPPSGPQAQDYTNTNPTIPGAGTPGMLPGSPPPGGPGTGTGGTHGPRPTVPLPLTVGSSADNGYVNPLSQLGNLSGPYTGGSIVPGINVQISGGGPHMKNFPFNYQHVVKDLIDAGVAPSDALAAVTRTPGDPNSQVGSGYTGGYQSGLAGHDSGEVAYGRVTSDVLLSSGLHAYGGTPVGGGHGLQILMDGLLVGMLTGRRHRREAFSLRDPVGCT